jgi:hypothetical protein
MLGRSKRKLKPPPAPKKQGRRYPFSKSLLSKMRRDYLLKGDTLRADILFFARKMCQAGHYAEAELYLLRAGIQFRSYGAKSNFKELLPLTTTSEHPYVKNIGRIDSKRAKH